ncbi:GMC oxidoreductase [Saccharopolyspora sp. NPDC000359]|uniref:GMC oxidoreductase n=1 Tax=Saccharopolyspora sp. NPDC000359 TaxID=3154251 RepID=UPI0033318003
MVAEAVGTPRRARCVVVGGGLAGLELAKELTGQDIDVRVLEAGPSDGIEHVNQEHGAAGALELSFDPVRDKHFHRPWRSESAPHYTANSGLRRRLGGRSLYWHGVALPIEEWALREPWWPREVVDDLTSSWRGGPPLYQRLAEQLGLPEVGLPTDDRQRAGAVAVGGVDFHRTPRACVVEPGGGRRWRAYSPLTSWPGGGQLLSSSEVLRVELRDGAVSGVLWRPTGTDRPERIAADAVVLCAGTIENNRLAIQALVEVGRLPEPKLTGLNDHLVQGFAVKVPARVTERAEFGVEPGSYVARADVGARSYLRFDVHPTATGLLLDVRMTGEQLPHEDSYVRCRPEPRYPWRTWVRSGLSAADREVVDGQRAALDAFWAELAHQLGLPAAALEFGDFDRPERDNTFLLPQTFDPVPELAPVTWTSLLGTEDHEGGGLAIGEVLDPSHEFRAVPGLYAAGPATFPRAGAANPSLTTLALAHRLAGVLAERYG